jgi:uncharacterized membrane protein YkvA (DUF1232 family)
MLESKLGRQQTSDNEVYVNWTLLSFGWKHGPELQRTLRTLAALSWQQRASLLGGLARDPRLPKRAKVAAVLLAAYVASPVDLIPDFIPLLGRLDDAVAMRLAIRVISSSLPEGLFQEHLRRVTTDSSEASHERESAY